MKKVLILIILVLLASGCITETEVLVDDSSGLVGIWTMTSSKQDKNDGAIIDKLTFQFYEDGNCIYSFRMLTGTNMDLPLEGKSEGTCYLNKNSNKFLMKSEGHNYLFNKWSSFQLDDNSLIIGDYTFTKAS